MPVNITYLENVYLLVLDYSLVFICIFIGLVGFQPVYGTAKLA
jgi:hypothetical protein